MLPIQSNSGASEVAGAAAAESTTRASAIYGLGLVILTGLIYARVCGFDFLSYDDTTNVSANPHLNPVSWNGLFFFWRHAYFSLYMPVTYTVWLGLSALESLQRTFSGHAVGAYVLNPHLFHSANLCVHVLNVLLVYALLRCFVKRNWAAAVGALLFGIHPVQVEPVAWVTGLNTLLATAFALVALRQYTLFARAANAEQGARSRRHYAWATVAFALALLSKPIAVMVPAIAWVVDRRLVGRGARPCTQALLPWLAMAAVCVLATEAAQTSVALPKPPLLLRTLVAADALDFYLFKLWVPLRLCPHYGRTPDWLLGQSWRFFTLLPPLLLGMLVWSRRKSLPCLTTAVWIFVLGVLPVLGFVPHYFQPSSTVADRYLYLAMLGPALLLACLLDRPGPKARVAVAVVLLTLAAVSWRQVGYWRDSKSIFEHTLTVNPHSWVAYVQLGNELDRAGQSDAAIADYRAALRLFPNLEIAQTNLSTAFLRRHQLDAAQACALAALAIDPSDERARVNLGMVWGDKGQADKALAVFRAVLREDPNFEPAHTSLANLLDELGQAEAARRQYIEALALAPDAPEVGSNYGMFLMHHGETAAALPLLLHVVELLPRAPEARYNLGLVLAQQQRFGDAAEQFSIAVALNPGYTEARYDLGIAEIKMGYPDRAVAQWRRTLSIDPSYTPARQALDTATRASK